MGNDNVGPGSYDQTSKNVIGNKNVGRKAMVPENVGFASGQDRFQSAGLVSSTKNGKNKSLYTPGPGTYNASEIQSLNAVVQKKSRDKIGVFGSTVKRFTGKEEPGQNVLTPGPGQYSNPTIISQAPSTAVTADVMKRSSSMFISKTKRNAYQNIVRNTQQNPGLQQVGLG